MACHKFTFVEKFDLLSVAQKGATFLLAAPYGRDEVWDRLPVEMQQQIIDKELKFHVIDAVKIAEELGLGSRINTIMQTAFFLISGVLPEDKALELIKNAITDTYGNKGPEIVEMNMKAVEATRSRIELVAYPKKATGRLHRLPPVSPEAPQFVREVIGEMIAGRGEKLATSQVPDDGTYPVGTTAYEKRNIAESVPEWLPEVCIQCGECSIQCPHGVIRFKAYDPALLSKRLPARRRRPSSSPPRPRARSWPG